MHAALEAICTELDKIPPLITALIPSDEPLNIIHGNPLFAGITRRELSSTASSISEFIRLRCPDVILRNEAELFEYPRRLLFLNNTLIPNMASNFASSVPSYLITLE